MSWKPLQVRWNYSWPPQWTSPPPGPRKPSGLRVWSAGLLQRQCSASRYHPAGSRLTRGALSLTTHHWPPPSFGRITEISLDPQNLQGHLGTCYKFRFLGPALGLLKRRARQGPEFCVLRRPPGDSGAGSSRRTTSQEKVGAAFPVNCPRARGWPRGSLSVPTWAELPAHWQGPHPSGLLRRWLSPGPAPPFSLPAVFLSLSHSGSACWPVQAITGSWASCGQSRCCWSSWMRMGAAAGSAFRPWGRWRRTSGVRGRGLWSRPTICRWVGGPSAEGLGRGGSLCSVCVCVCVCSRLLLFPPPPFLLPVPLFSYSLSVLPSLSLSLPLFHSTNQPKCPLRASNPAEVQKWITACILYPGEVYSLVRSCELLRPQVDSHFPSCYHAFSLHSSPGVHAHTHPHFVQRRKPGNAGVTPQTWQQTWTSRLQITFFF